MSLSTNLFYKDTWDKVLEYLRNSNRIETPIIDNFYLNSQIFDMNEKKAIISVPTEIQKQIVQTESLLIETALTDILKLDQKINVDIVPVSELSKYMQYNDEDEDSVLDIKMYPYFEGEDIATDRTFDNFVVGDSNRESNAAALACAYNPGKFFNPLFIYGNSGLGKTHLLLSIANYIKSHDSTKKVYYTSSSRFVENVVESIKLGKIDAFKKYMYSIDVLLIDDIQFIAGKEKSHEVFFNIFNELVNNRKQICIASDRLPEEIKGLEDRLISRFASGLSVGIDSPEFETSLAILKMKIKSSGYEASNVDDEVLSFIASNFSRDVRQLEGALNRVLFYAIQFQNDGERINFTTASNALKNQIVISDKSGLSPKKIIKTVADYYGLTKQQLISKTRTKNIANARHIAIYLCRKLLDLPYIKIGEEFGGKDHSTIISACGKVDKLIKKDTAYAQAVSEIEKILNS